MSGVLTLAVQYGPMLTAQMMSLKAEKIDYEKKATFAVFFLVLLIAGYCYLWINYLCLGIVMTYFSIGWMDSIGEAIGRKHDMVFLPLLVVTNLVYLGISMFSPPAWASTLCQMLLEGMHSAFNGARVWNILKSTNAIRAFHPLEVLAETVLIEIAPVTLLAYGGGVIDELDEWDRIGAWGLIPLFVLLAIDFNAGNRGEDKNEAIMVDWVVRFVRFLFDYVENFCLAAVGIVLAVQASNNPARPAAGERR